MARESRASLLDSEYPKRQGMITSRSAWAYTYEGPRIPVQLPETRVHPRVTIKEAFSPVICDAACGHQRPQELFTTTSTLYLVSSVQL
jgi:hypothetical protein